MLCFVVGATKYSRADLANRDKRGPGESLSHVPEVTKDSLVCQGEKDSLNKVTILGFPAPKAHPYVYFHTPSMWSTRGSFWPTGAAFSMVTTKA